MNQKTFLSSASRYFNTGVLHRSDKLCAIFKADWPLRKNAAEIKSGFDLLETTTNPAPFESYNIEKYSGSNITANRISAYLKEHLATDLLCAVAHGSIATDEQISYSDFDGLVIIRNEVFSNEARIKHVAEHLSKSYSLMIQGDPLQHHGWFVLTEKDISNWPAYYFPPVVFNYSKSLLNDTLQLKIQNNVSAGDSKTSLTRMAATINKTLLKHNFPDNAYQLKSLLSEFMLLPTLFMQAMTGQGIYKKQSFTEAKNHIDPEVWKVMDKISEIRSSWDINSGIVLPENPVLVTPVIKRKQISNSKLVPDYLQSKLTDQLRQEMLKFTRFVVTKIQ